MKIKEAVLKRLAWHQQHSKSIDFGFKATFTCVWSSSSITTTWSRRAAWNNCDRLLSKTRQWPRGRRPPLRPLSHTGSPDFCFCAVWTTAVVREHNERVKYVSRLSSRHRNQERHTNWGNKSGCAMQNNNQSVFWVRRLGSLCNVNVWRSVRPGRLTDWLTLVMDDWSCKWRHFFLLPFSRFKGNARSRVHSCYFKFLLPWWL